jgi:hypothetical protein
MITRKAALRTFFNFCRRGDGVAQLSMFLTVRTCCNSGWVKNLRCDFENK